MPDTIFTAIYSGSSSVTLPVFLAITASALILGLTYALLYRALEHCSRSFALTLSLLPAVVSITTTSSFFWQDTAASIIRAISRAKPAKR